MSETVYTRYQDIPCYNTKDGSDIRELMHPDHHGVSHQSLAEATVYPGQTTALHRHQKTEELYFITQGQGEMHLGDEWFSVTVGDTVCISPGTSHQIKNSGQLELKFLCCCSPAYAHDDTELL